jgi:hypothetical protein
MISQATTRNHIPMADKEHRIRRTLRALRGGDEADSADTDQADGLAGAGPEPAESLDQAQPSETERDEDGVDGLESAVAALESKLDSGAGIDGLAAWLREVEATLKALEDSDLDTTRDDIRGVIDRLLGINAEIQNVVRLKKLLS